MKKVTLDISSKIIKKAFYGFSEAYISEIKPLEIKGWVLHKNKVSNFIVINGHVKFVFFESL